MTNAIILKTNPEGARLFEIKKKFLFLKINPEIDNIVHVRGHADTGAFHEVKITEVNEYELIGDIVS